MSGMSNPTAANSGKSSARIFEKLHPQTSSFFNLFPPPDGSISSTVTFAQQFQQLWNENFKDLPWSLIGFSAIAPDFDDLAAEKGGTDYTCRIKVHFRNGNDEKNLRIDDLPYPNNNGEFVINGNRYFIPMFLRDSKQRQNMELDRSYFKELKEIRNNTKSKDIGDADTLKAASSESRKKSKEALAGLPHERLTDQLHVILLDELLQNDLVRLVETQFTEFIKTWDGAKIPKQNIPLSRKLLHPFINKYGQLVDKENPLSRLSQLKELSFYGFWGGLHPESINKSELLLRDVSDNDFNRICPVQTPQGHQVGLRLYLARRASIDMQNRRIAPPESPKAGDSLSDAASLIPFVEHNDVARALMGSNMMKQALPLVQPDIPWIQTGWERKIAGISFTPDDFKRDGVLCMGKNLTAAYIPWGLDTFEDGIVISESASRALAAYEEKTYWINVHKKYPHGRNLVETVISRDNPKLPDKKKRHLDESGIIRVGTEVNPGDILVSAFDEYSEAVKKTDIIDMYARATSSKPLKIKNCSLYVPANYRGKVIEIIKIESDKGISPQDKLISRIGIVIRHEIKVSIGDKICSRHGSKGVVVRILNDHEMPYFKTDTACCSNKECIIKDPHRHVQIILNPVGVIGRLNVGQLYETTLAKIAEKNNTSIIVPPFQNPWNRQKLSEALKSKGFADDGREQLFIIEEGKERPLHYQSLVGPQYILRLHHLSEHKIQARGIEEPFDYTARDNQPRVGKRIFGDRVIGSAQRVGEMETWALAGHGAWHILDDLLNVKSDDDLLRKQSKVGAFVNDDDRRPQALVNLILLFRALSLDLRLLNRAGQDVTSIFIENKSGTAFSNVSLSWAKDDRIADWRIIGEVTSEKLFTSKKGETAPEFDPHGLYSRTIFPPDCNWQMGKISLAKPVPHPGNSDLHVNIIPVLPKIFRTEKNDVTNYEDDLNVLYQHVIVANNNLRRYLNNKNEELKWFEVLKKRIETLFFGGRVYGRERKGIYDVLRGKQGLIRGHLAGKRADYSGRAVIVADPELALDEVGIPEMLWEQFFPDISKSEKPFILINRQPSLHRYSFQSFRATCHQRGNVVGMNPFVCKPFNADFDGDTVSIHVPRKPAAKKEAEQLLPSRNLLSQANGKPVLGFEKDIAFGVVYITYHPKINCEDQIPFSTDEEFPLNRRELWERVAYQNIETTVGRLLFRRLFPENIVVHNRCMTSKDWDRLLSDLFAVASASQDWQLIPDFTRKLSRLLMPALKHSGLSLSLPDFIPLAEAPQKEKMPSFLWFLRQTAKYNEDLEKQLITSRGLMRRPGDDKPTTEIPSSLMEGHSEMEYLITAHGARSGLVDKGVITAPAGSELRKWIYHLQHLYVVEMDCKSLSGFDSHSVDAGQIVGIRYDTTGGIINELREDQKFRSPLTCNGRDPEGNPGICVKCYGNDPATGRLPEIGLPVGILAAEAIGERVSQETMKSFHTGGTQKTESKESSEKAGLELIDLLRGDLSKYKKGEIGPLQTIQSIWKYFPGSNKPRMVHFEVLVKGSSDEYTGLLSAIVKSQDQRQIFKLATSEQSDNLFSVMGRIISGMLIKGAIDG